MAATGDLIEEFKNAKPPEKTVILLGIAAVGGIGLYLYIKNKGASAAAATDPNAATTQQTSGYPTANGVPVLPNGVNPLYDPNGNLTGYQNQTTPGSQGTPGPQGPPGPPGPAAHPANWFTNILGKLGYGANITPGGVDANGQRFWVGKGNSYLFYAPVGTTIKRGAQGRVWLTAPGQNEQLLTGPGLTPAKNPIILKTSQHIANK